MSVCWKVIYYELVDRQFNMPMFNCKGVSKSYQRTNKIHRSSSELLCCALRMHLPYPHHLMNLKQSVTWLHKNLWPLQLDTVERIPHCLWMPHISLPQESLVYRASLHGTDRVQQSWQRRVSSTWNLRISMFILVAHLGEAWQSNEN